MASASVACVLPSTWLLGTSSAFSTCTSTQAWVPCYSGAGAQAKCPRSALHMTQTSLIPGPDLALLIHHWGGTSLFVPYAVVSAMSHISSPGDMTGGAALLSGICPRTAGCTQHRMHLWLISGLPAEHSAHFLTFVFHTCRYCKASFSMHDC